MTISPEQLSQHWAATHSGTQDAIEWITKVRTYDKLVDNDADDLILNLRRVRNTCRRLGTVTTSPMTVGFFGLSQAGKSYLISALVSDVNGKFQIDLGDDSLDFIDHINPPGGGKEATALVTRFSRTAKPGPAGYPLELKLFSEIELAFILANSFFNDFNKEKVNYAFEETRIRNILARLETHRQNKPVPGINQDDVVALWDYLMEGFPSSLKGLEGYFWPKAINLAPFLTLNDRAELFSIFWGEIPELSEAYLNLSKTLAALGNVGRVFAPLEVLVMKNQEGEFSQAESIMNVANLQKLGKPEDKQVFVHTNMIGGQAGAISLSLGQLSALTAEMVLPLAETMSRPMFEHVDLLDFPGYRGRLNVESFEEVRNELSGADSNPLAQLVLRGKVAYLFERYTENQEMNVLVVCTPSEGQLEVNSLGPALNRWIEKTQGESAESRAERKPGLLWALTKYDKRIDDDLTKTKELMRVAISGLVTQTILEKFGKYQWIQEWFPNVPFRNTFLVRKPRMAVSFLSQSDTHETQIREESRDKLELMESLFCEDKLVQRHINDPKDAWGGMLALNDGGIERISRYLHDVAKPEIKHNRLCQQLENVIDTLETRFKIHHLGNQNEELQKKRETVNRIKAVIWERRALLGELLQQMQLPEENLRVLYFQAGETNELLTQPTLGSATDDGPLNLGTSYSEDDDFDIFGSELTSAKPAPTTSGSDARFAQSVLRKWTSHLHQIPNNQSLANYLGFSKSVLSDLVSEIHLGAERHHLEKQLLEKIIQTEQIGTKREQLVGRQVLTARVVLADFIAWLGFYYLREEERPESRINKGKPLFDGIPPPKQGMQPILPQQPVEHASRYIGDWLVALLKLAEDNVGQTGGRGITPEQNEQLGNILSKFNLARMR